MAYTDSKGWTRGRVQALGISAVVQVAVAYGLLTGLSFSMTRALDPETFIDNLVQERVKPAPPEHPHTQQQQQQRQIDTVTPQIPTTHHDDGFTLPPPPPLPPTGDLGPVIEHVDPPVPPIPHFAAIAVSPHGSPQSWVTQEDYPGQAQREGLEGTTGVRLSVGEDGRVTNCDVTTSSGSHLLDETACRLLAKRAHFNLGRDTEGKAVGGSYSTRFTWKLDKDQ